MPFSYRMFLFLAVLVLWLGTLCADIQQLSSEIYLNRRVSGVFHYDQRNRYSLTFPSAKLACEQHFGARLATRDQLHVAYLAGLEECRAGWISEREVAYPRIHRNWNCGQNRVGVISYGIRKNLLENWDVYCYKWEDDRSVLNMSMELEDNTPRDRTENLSLYSVLPTSWKNRSKKPVLEPGQNLSRTGEYKKKLIPFPNVVTAPNTKHLSGSETLTELNAMTFTLSSILSPVNSSASNSIKKSVKGFTTEYPDTQKHYLVSKESSKISAMEEAQLTSNRANSGMTNKLPKQPSKDYSAVNNTTDASITTPEVSEELLQTRNVTGDTTAKSLWIVTADHVSEHEVVKLSVVSIDVSGDPARGISPQRNVGSHEEVMAAIPQPPTQTPVSEGKSTEPANTSNVQENQTSTDSSKSLQSSTQSDHTDRFLFTESKAILLTEVKVESYNGFTPTTFSEEMSERILSGVASPAGFTVAPFSAVIHSSVRFVGNTVITGSTDVAGKQMFLSQTSPITVSKEVSDESSKPSTNIVEAAENVSSSVIEFGAKTVHSGQDIYHQRDPHYLSGLIPQGDSLNRSAQFSSIDSNTPGYQHEETHREANNTGSGLQLENNSPEMMESDPLDLPVQIQHHDTKGKFNTIDRDESKPLTAVWEGGITQHWAGNEDLLALSPTVNTNVPSNAALTETTPARNHLEPEALRVKDTAYLSEKMQEYHGTVPLSTSRRDDTILSGTESEDREVMRQGHTPTTPTSESKIQLGMSSHRTIGFPETTTSSRKEERVTDKLKDISQEAISNIDQLGTRPHMTVDNETERYESGAIGHIKLSELIPEETRLDVKVGTEIGRQMVTASVMNTEQPVTYSIDRTSGAAVIAGNSILSGITSDLDISLQYTDSENHTSQSTVFDTELTAPSVDGSKLQKAVSTESSSKQGISKKDYNDQLFIQPTAEMLQSATSQSENRNSVSAITNKNDLSASNTVPTDDKVPTLIYKGNNSLQEIPTVFGTSGKPFSLSTQSWLEQRSFVGGSADVSGMSTRSHTDLPAPVTASPLSKEESSQHSAVSLTSVQISSSSASTGFVNITESTTSASLDSMQTLATGRSLQLHLPATSSSPVVTTGTSTETTSASPPALSFVPLDSCGDVPKGTAGTFQSPGYPQSYPRDMDCIWVIKALPGYFVQLNFTFMSIERHKTCKYDYVTVYDGKGPNKVEMGRFCGSEVPAKLQTSSNTMTIVMQSDSSVELEGFSAQFSTFHIPSAQIRLVRGWSMYSGLVEVEFDGKWGGICAKQWDRDHAKVVCHQLGFTGPALAIRIKLSKRRIPLAVSYAQCKGDEKILQNCDIRRTGKCTSNERAAVICQVLESCAALKTAGVLESGLFTVDPDGTEGGVDAFPVECDMVSDPTTGISIIGHDSEERMRVTPCEDAGCYSHTISYNKASLDQLRVLIEASESCEQYVSVECRHVRFLKQGWGWWVSHDGRQIYSWGGASTDSGKCACGENDNCALALSTCNCDANDAVWRQDEGFLRDKSTLPVREVRFGDTQDVPVEMAFHRIGALHCSGYGPKVPVLESCAALKEAGFHISKRYHIDPDGIGQGVLEFAVFCDMTSDPFTAITVVSHDSETRQRVASCEEPGCYSRELSYQADLIQLNALTRVSESCEQHVKLDCRHIRFIQSGWGWWVSWDGRRMFYWGDANPDSGSCACGMTGSCSVPGKLCNCDSNDHIWRTDEGLLRDKSTLPIRSVHFGDTRDVPLEMAFHTIGKLMCKGIALQRKHLNPAK